MTTTATTTADLIDRSRALRAEVNEYRRLAVAATTAREAHAALQALHDRRLALEAVEDRLALLGR